MNCITAYLSGVRVFSRFVLILFVLLPIFASAQSFRGSIRGKITDPTGSLVVGAKVTARSKATGLVRETVSADDGAYVLAELPVGEYVVTVQAQGFRAAAIAELVEIG